MYNQYNFKAKNNFHNIKELFVSYKSHLVEDNKKLSNVSIKNYLSDISQFITWYDKYYSLTNILSPINEEVINHYKTIHFAAGSPKTYKRFLSSLNNFCEFLIDKNLLENNPVDTIRKNTRVIDYLHIKEYTNYLYTLGLSAATIKNYSADVYQFIEWYEYTFTISKNVLLEHINANSTQEYSQYILGRAILSQASITRKISAINKYISWLLDNRYIISTPANETLPITPKNTMSITQATYSYFPPFRVIQKINKVFILFYNTFLITSLAHGMLELKYFVWKIHPKNLFFKVKANEMYKHSNQNKSKQINRAQKVLKTSNTDSYLLYYFNLFIITLFISVIGFGFYKNFLEEANKKNNLFAFTPQLPAYKTLAFKGRLVDKNQQPFKNEQIVHFSLYNNKDSQNDSALWTDESTIQPDNDGYFSVVLGTKKQISQELFSLNNHIYLGISIGDNQELKPRQEIPTTGYAYNAESVQGLLPINASGSNYQNVILALDSSGNLNIGGNASSLFQVNGGDFTLSGQTLFLTSNLDSNGDIILAPDGSGEIDLQKPLKNTSLYNNIPSAQGAVEVDDLFAILATSSGQSAFTINQNGLGPIISASSSGNAKFTLDNEGNGIFAGQLSVGNYASPPVSVRNGSIYYDTNDKNLFFFDGSLWKPLSSNIWGINNNIITPSSINASVLFGGNSTGSAQFAFLTGANATASFAANLTFNKNSTIATTNKQTLTIGDTNTGDIVVNQGGLSAFIINKFNNMGDILSASSAGITTLSISATGNIQTIGNTFASSSKVFNLLNSNVTTLNLGNAATTLTLGSQEGNTTINNTLSLANNLVGNNKIIFNGKLEDTLGGTCNGSTDDTTIYIPAAIHITTDHIFYNQTKHRHTKIESISSCNDNTNEWQKIILSDPILGQQVNDLASIYSPSTDIGNNSNGFINNAYIVNPKFISTVSTNQFDLAEQYPTQDLAIEAGDVIKISTTISEHNKPYIEKAQGKEDNLLLGVISTNPGIRLGNETLGTWKNVALAGRVPVKVSIANGTIKKGDYITSSLIPGVGVKATHAGIVIGKALEDDNQPGISKISVFINLSWQDPDIYLTTLGELNINENNHYLVEDAQKNPLVRMSAFSETIIGILHAGMIDTKKLITKSLDITTDNITIAGISFKDYIADTLSSLLKSPDFYRDILSQLHDAHEIHTNIISPLDNNSDLTFKIASTSASKTHAFHFQDRNSKDILSLTENGEASLAGTLTTNNLYASENATISGNLYSSNILGNTITGENLQTSSLSANYIHTQNDLYLDNQSSILFSHNDSLDSNIASFSAYLSYIPKLDTKIVTVDQAFMALGISSLSDTSITGQLSIGKQFVLAENSINVIGNDLLLQPLKQGGISIADRQIYIDNLGNLSVNGNAIFNKNIAVNTITPIGDNDITIKLQDNISNTNSKFAIKDSSGSSILSINHGGDIISSGAASINKLNFNLIEPALALSDTDILATGSAGTAMVKDHHLEVTIHNKNVTEKSLIYITPVGNPNSMVPFLIRQLPQESFTVGISDIQSSNILFNWLIIN